MPKSSHYLNRFLDNTDRIQFFYWGTYSETGDPYVKVSQTGFYLLLGEARQYMYIVEVDLHTRWWAVLLVQGQSSPESNR